MTDVSLFRPLLLSSFFLSLLFLLNPGKVDSRSNAVIIAAGGVSVTGAFSSTREALVSRDVKNYSRTISSFAPTSFRANVRPGTRHRNSDNRPRLPYGICDNYTDQSTTTITSRTTIGRWSSSTSLSALSVPSLPLISATDQWGNIAALCTTASVAQTLGKTTAIGRLLGPPVTAMAMAFVLGSVGVLPPGGSQAAKTLMQTSVQFATPLLLLSVDLRECRQRCGPLFLAFTIAATATILSSALATHATARPLLRALGTDGLKVAAALMAKNVGGGLNYVAVCRSLGVGYTSIAAGLCVDNVMALLYFPVTSAMAAGRPDLGNDSDSTAAGGDVGAPEQQPITVESISKALSLAAVATFLGERIGGPSYALPLSTLLTLLYTTLYPSTLLTVGPTGNAIGTSLLYLFFATAGAPGLTIADSVRSSFLPLGCFLTILYVGHGAIIAGARLGVLAWERWWCRRKGGGGKGAGGGKADAVAVVAPQRLLVASSASIGGPATAAALAQANGWTSLVGPSLVVGNFGYAIATFIGIFFHSVAAKLYL